MLPIHPSMLPFRRNTLHLPGTASTVVMHVFCQAKRYSSADSSTPQGHRSTKTIPATPKPQNIHCICIVTVLVYGVDGGGESAATEPIGEGPAACNSRGSSAEAGQAGAGGCASQLEGCS